MESELFQVSLLLGLPRTMPATVWSEIVRDISHARSRIPRAAQNKSIYLEVDNGPYAAGTSSFLGKIIAMLGLGNIIPASLGPFPKINPEFVVQKNPDVIIIGERDQINLADRPGWSGLSAVRQGQVCILNGPAMEVLVRPGPRIGESAQQLADCIARKFQTDNGPHP